MIRLLAIASFILILFGCSKNDATSRQPSFKFKANGTLYQSTSPGNEPVIKKLTLYSRPEYYFTSDISSSVSSSTVNVFDVSIHVDTLKVGEYNGTVYSNSAITGNVFINLIHIPETNCVYGSSIAQLSITITRVSKGTADGVFSGSDKLTGGTCGTRTVLYTEGEFKNVKIFN